MYKENLFFIGFILKIVAAAVSKSLLVVSTVIDSTVDLPTSVILFWTWRAIKRGNRYRYPPDILNFVSIK